MDRVDMLGFALCASQQDDFEDRGAAFPASDVKDLAAGARFIPSEVTLARRTGDRVEFVQGCGPCCWYWLFEDSSKLYHFERYTFDMMKKGQPDVDIPVCPHCENSHTNGAGAKRVR